MSVEATGETSTAGGLYTRQSSGLVRTVSLRSNLALNISNISIPIAVLTVTQIPVSFPGASPFLVWLFAGVLCLAPTLLFALFTALMPRSGGDYVFVSRTLHPWLGFAGNFMIVAFITLALTWLSYLIAPFGLSSLFTTLGDVVGSDSLIQAGTDVAGDGWAYAIGIVSCVLCVGLMSFNLRWALKVFVVIVAISLIGVLITLVILLTNDRGDFVAAVASHGGNYDKIIADARAAGFVGNEQFSLSNTLAAMPLTASALLFPIVTAYMGSEVRSPKTTGVRAMVGALGIAVALMLILIALTSSVMGNDFLGAATFLSTAGDANYPFASPSFFFYFVSIMTGSGVVAAIIGVSFTLAFFTTMVATFCMATRGLFAWSFDRIMPLGLSKVNARTHTPIRAHLVLLAVMLIYLTLIVYGSDDFLTVIYTAVLGCLFGFVVFAVAAMVFPFRRKGLYELSWLKAKIAGIPVFSVVAAISLGVYLLFLIQMLTDDRLGANAGVGIKALILVGAIAILGFPLAYYIRRRQGIDLNLAAKELPPE